ncbi:MAG TPA: hypothetical protein VHL14_01230 [Steroidobacteraceae bacterium]|nr:hypothetical protein [Steroidobacteraceae bacterium]
MLRLKKTDHTIGKIVFSIRTTEHILTDNAVNTCHCRAARYQKLNILDGTSCQKSG